MSRNLEAKTLDHSGPKLRVEEEAGTLDHSGPELTVEEAAETLDHGGPKLIEKGEADMGNQKKSFVAETEDRVTDKEQLPESGGCIFF